jgi:hypothetical protein
LAGTWKQYSSEAIIQLKKITLGRGVLRYLRWPYQAKVMKILEMVNSTIVVISAMLPDQPGFAKQTGKPLTTGNSFS